ncbi:MAG: hypothetical protein ACTSWN_03770 [Promethearchaeota archaeon]
MDNEILKIRLKDLFTLMDDYIPGLEDVLELFILKSEKKTWTASEISRDTGFSAKKTYEILKKLNELGFIGKIAKASLFYPHPLIGSFENYKNRSLDFIRQEYDAKLSKLNDLVDKVVYLIACLDAYSDDEHNLEVMKYYLKHSNIYNWGYIFLQFKRELLISQGVILYPTFGESLNFIQNNNRDLKMDEFLLKIRKGDRRFLFLMDRKTFNMYLSMLQDPSNKEFNLMFTKILDLDKLRIVDDPISTYMVIDNKLLVFPNYIRRGSRPEIISHYFSEKKDLLNSFITNFHKTFELATSVLEIVRKDPEYLEKVRNVIKDLDQRLEG